MRNANDSSFDANMAILEIDLSLVFITSASKLDGIAGLAGAGHDVPVEAEA